MDINKIAELANIMKQNGLTKLKLTEGESHLVLEAGKSEGVVVPMVQESVQVPPMPKEQPKKMLEDDFMNRKHLWWGLCIWLLKVGQYLMFLWATISIQAKRFALWSL